MKLEPLDDRVVVSPLSAEETTSGGVILPDSAKEKPKEGKIIAAFSIFSVPVKKPNKGKVVAVGPGKLRDDGERIPPAVKKGAVVFYGKYAGTEVKVAGDEFKILRESDILAVEE